MSEMNYNVLLYEKMKAEQDKYQDWLLRQAPEEILNHTYEYTMREDIVMCMEELEIEPSKAKALLRSPCPLSDVFDEFKDREVEHMDTIRDSIETDAQSGVHGQIGACETAEHLGHPAFLYHECGCRSRTYQGRLQPCSVCQ